jgi:hypothetical protein
VHAPVLVELPLHLIAEVLSPHSVQCSETLGGRHIAHNTHYDDRWSLNDGDSLHIRRRLRVI